jgi:antibiotic biosynthesis monooxygenase (ABM) superfamily enzyme
MQSAPTDTPAATGPVRIVVQTRVAPGHDAEFAQWQQEVNDVIAQFPGFLEHRVLPPNPPVQVDWVIVQRFASEQAARAWLQSDKRLALINKIQPLLVGQDDVHLFSDSDESNLDAAPVTVVISMRVRPGEEAAFQDWQRRIAAVEATFPGYSGYKLEPPVPGVQDDWVTIIRFDSDAHLDAWLDSPERKKLLEETPRFSPEFHTRKIRSGFESWFPHYGQTGGPPNWKMQMMVLLMLYPTVFLLGFFIGTPLLGDRGVPFWLQLFIMNTSSTILLGWWFVRWASIPMDWWLNPTPPVSPRVHWLGAAVVVALYCLSMLIFSQFPPRL